MEWQLRIGEPPPDRFALFPHEHREAMLELRDAIVKHEYLYHWTIDRNLASITGTGIDPAKISCTSRYPTALEPAEVMRYCTIDALEVGRSAAQARADEQGGGTLVLLRVPASEVLDRRYGLDPSDGHYRNRMLNTLEGRQTLTVAQCRELLKERGMLSCYDLLPSRFIEQRSGCTWQPLE